jgi:hypothetical protein
MNYIQEMRLVWLTLFSVAAIAQTEAPEGQRAVFTAQAKGVQIYACQQGKWTFQAPEAALFEGAKQIGTHGAGPQWTLTGGRSVKGRVVAKADAPATGDIPWLLLKGEGSFEYIRRWDTHGGVAPAGVCEDGKTLRVPYTATYTFYRAR